MLIHHLGFRYLSKSEEFTLDQGRADLVTRLVPQHLERAILPRLGLGNLQIKTSLKEVTFDFLRLVAPQKRF